MIIEDNLDLSFILRELFKLLRYDTVIFNKIADVIHLVKRHEPDLVIMDYLMPGTNGAGLCMQLRSNPETIRIPLILYSAYLTGDLNPENYSCDAIVRKPFDLEDLIGVVEYLITCFSPYTVQKQTGCCAK